MDRVCVWGQRAHEYIDGYGMFIRLAYKPKVRLVVSINSVNWGREVEANTLS